MAKAKKKLADSSNAVIIGMVALLVVSIGAVLAALFFYAGMNSTEARAADLDRKVKTLSVQVGDVNEKYARLKTEVAGDDKELRKFKEVAPDSPSLYTRIDELVKQAKSVTEERDSLKNAVDTAEKDRDRATESKTKSEATLGKEVDDLKKQSAAKEEAAQQKIKQLDGDLSAEKDKSERLAGEKKAQSERFAITEQQLKTENARLKKELEDLKHPKPVGGVTTGVDVRVKGRILTVDSEHNFVVVDIGSADKARKGMRFDVYDAEPGAAAKGVIELTQVNETNSIADVVSLANRFSPLLKGDALISPVFNRGAPTHYVVAGDFKKLNVAQIKSLIAEQGGIIDDDVTQATDYLVVSPDYKGDLLQKANQFGTVVVREDKFLAMMGK